MEINVKEKKEKGKRNGDGVTGVECAQEVLCTILGMPKRPPDLARSLEGSESLRVQHMGARVVKAYLGVCLELLHPRPHGSLVKSLAPTADGTGRYDDIFSYNADEDEGVQQRRVNLINWDEVRQSVQSDGLGFRDLEVVNIFRPQKQAHHHNPAPQSYPIVGNLPGLFRNRHRFHDWVADILSETPSSTLQVNSFLNLPHGVCTANPVNVHHLLIANFHNYVKGSRFHDHLHELLGHGIFGVDDDLWTVQRKISSHEFNTKSLKHFISDVVTSQLTHNLIPRFANASDENRVVNFKRCSRDSRSVISVKLRLGSIFHLWILLILILEPDSRHLENPEITEHWIGKEIERSNRYSQCFALKIIESKEKEEQIEENRDLLLR
ncbi:hypothetical protein GQ457_03G003510 [Hibiscus cannabinus]